MKKAYEYFIYTTFSFFLKQKDGVPIGKTIIFISLFLWLNIATIFVVLLRLFPVLDKLFDIDSYGIYIYIWVVGGLFMIENYLIFYNKKKWNSYIEKYGKETAHERNRGRFFVLTYYILSPVLFYAMVILLLNKN